MNAHCVCELHGGWLATTGHVPFIGWWFVTVEDLQGWFPSTLLEPKRVSLMIEDDQDQINNSPMASTELYYATRGYFATREDEVSLIQGSTLEVLHMSTSGWWTVK